MPVPTKNDIVRAVEIVARERVDKGQSPTIEQARADVLDTPLGRELYGAYLGARPGEPAVEKRSSPPRPPGLVLIEKIAEEQEGTPLKRLSEPEAAAAIARAVESSEGRRAYRSYVEDLHRQ